MPFSPTSSHFGAWVERMVEPAAWADGLHGRLVERTSVLDVFLVIAFCLVRNRLLVQISRTVIRPLVGVPVFRHFAVVVPDIRSEVHVSN